MAERTDITEEERELSAGDPPLPYGVVWRLLRERERRERDLRTRNREAARSTAALADDLGLSLHKLRDFVRISGPGMRAAGLDDEVELLCTIAYQLGTALDHAGAEIIEPAGRRYNDVADFVEVVYAEAGVPQEHLAVTVTVQAGLRMATGELVRRAKVELGALPQDGAEKPAPGIELGLPD
ncbi:MAG: hypothetical protein ACRDRS_00790 [Pseudonocardiaceae bacterium]